MRVLMLPWLAHGHISPFLELAKKLADRHICVYFCSTPVTLEPIKKKLNVERYSLSIHLVELHLPSSPDLPPHLHTTNGLPPHLMAPLQQALHMAAPSFSGILESLHPDLVIYDFIHSWAPAQAASFNIPAVQFLTLSASTAAFFSHILNVGISGFPLPEICHDISKVSGGHPSSREHASLAMRRSCKILLLRTFREIEGKYLDHLDASVGKRMVPVGPLVKDPAGGDDDFARWLDAKDPSSTVFVSFGSEYFCSKEELEEIANGLELSKVNFIWVIRSPEGERRSLEELLPYGFMERVGERGLAVEGWAPQMRILAHKSVGGFVSHCGWSSVLESMKLGVPIIAMPEHIDQPINAKLVSALGFGVEVRRDECGKYTRGEIMKAVRKVVVEEHGKDLQRKARDLSQVIVKKGDEDVDEAVRELVQICKEYAPILVQIWKLLHGNHGCSSLTLEPFVVLTSAPSILLFRPRLADVGVQFASAASIALGFAIAPQAAAMRTALFDGESAASIAIAPQAAAAALPSRLLRPHRLAASPQPRRPPSLRFEMVASTGLPPRLSI